MFFFFPLGGRCGGGIILKPEKDADSQFYIYFMFTKTNYQSSTSFPLPCPAFPKVFYTDLLLPRKHPSNSQMRSCFKQHAGSGSWVLLTLQLARKASCVTQCGPTAPRLMNCTQRRWLLGGEWGLRLDGWSGWATAGNRVFI